MIQPLKRTAAFRDVSRRGRWAKSACFSVGILPTRLAERRFGLRTPRGVANAVRRNRLKRQLREILRRHAHELHPGMDMVIVLRPSQRAVPTATLEQQLLRLCAQLGARAKA